MNYIKGNPGGILEGRRKKKIYAARSLLPTKINTSCLSSCSTKLLSFWGLVTLTLCSTFRVRGGNSFANTGIMPYSCGCTHLCKYSLYQAWATQFESAICYLAVTHAQYISCPTGHPLKTDGLFIVGIVVQNTHFGVIKYWVRILFLLLNSSVTLIKLLNFFQPL